ncbi:MAG: Coenzyme F420 hydrogenase/dehydrogenase, beta subunit C-terminal domain [Thermoplasmatota archaeon]
MTTQKILPVKNSDINSAINQLLKQLLETKKISAVLAPQNVPSKKVSFPVLISDPNKLDTNIFAPVLPVSTAKMISKITKFQASEKPIAVILHPCQMKALIELVKLNQANLDNVITIGIDCPGTFSLNSYAGLAEKSNPLEMIIDDMQSNSEKTNKYLRSACLVCNEPVASNVDVNIGIFGMDIKKQVLLEAGSDAGKNLIKDIKLDDFKNGKKRNAFIEQLIEKQTKKLHDFIKQKISGSNIEKITALFDTCVNCHNCMRVCPICYCRECLFDSSVFDAEAYKYLKKSESKGLYKMPDDSLLFHLGRMNHMILSCVKCGLCEQACPMEIALMDVFIPTAENSQEEFGYHPGKNPKEKIPMIVYREDEYVDVGEQ